MLGIWGKSLELGLEGVHQRETKGEILQARAQHKQRLGGVRLRAGLSGQNYIGRYISDKAIVGYDGGGDDSDGYGGGNGAAVQDSEQQALEEKGSLSSLLCVFPRIGLAGEKGGTYRGL